MKGLLIKDFKLLRGQKTLLILVVFIAVGMLASLSNPGFVIGYMTFIGAFCTLNTISYDEFDNGNTFLFSLPITRKGYVEEKYLFGIAVGGAECLLSLVVTLIFGCVKGSFDAKEILLTGGMVFAALFFMISIMLPFQLKFGGEKGRVAMIVAFGLVFLAGFLVKQIAGMFHLDLTGMQDYFSSMGMGMLLVVVYAVALVVCLISMKISIAIMEKKEF